MVKASDFISGDRVAFKTQDGRTFYGYVKAQAAYPKPISVKVAFDDGRTAKIWPEALKVVPRWEGIE